MKTKQRSFQTDAFTRGGQIFSHEWRMRFQNLRLVFVLSLPFLGAGTLLAIKLLHVSWWHFIDFYTFAYVGGHLKIILWHGMQPFLQWFDHQTHGGAPWAFVPSRDFITHLRFPHGGILTLRTVDFLNHGWVKIQAAYLHQGVILALSTWFLSMGALYTLLWRKSRRLEDGKIMEGLEKVTPQKLQQLLKRQGRASNLRLTPELSLVKDAETQHLMIIGTTGSGKTNCIHGLLKQIMAKNQSVLVLDTNGGYVNRYYEEGRGDVILNPFDTRSVRWDLWQDCKETPDFDAFATALIPEPPGSSNPVWHKNAREIISTTAEKLALKGDPTLQALIETASWKALSQVKSFFENTPVESLMSGQGRAEETVHSVRMQMTEAMKRLALIPLEGTPFSINDWILKGPPGSWLFISCSEKDRATLGPLMKFWVSLAIQSLLRRGEALDHRLWFILDELFSLEGGSVPNLVTLLSEGRKYGGCALLGFQSLAGFEKAQGATGMKEVITLCNTKIILRTPEPQNAGYLSQVLGETEILESSESLSMGAHHMRDGVNLSSGRRLRPVVSKTEIMMLPNLQAFVSLGGDLPITQVTFTINKVPLKYHQQDYQRSLSLLSMLIEHKLNDPASFLKDEEKALKEKNNFNLTYDA